MSFQHIFWGLSPRSIYSYSSLEWRTVSPYLAGTLTVALHLRFRNPLASIVAGTALYMALLRV